jgi:hypothetical protein
MLSVAMSGIPVPTLHTLPAPPNSYSYIIVEVDELENLLGPSPAAGAFEQYLVYISFRDVPAALTHSAHDESSYPSLDGAALVDWVVRLSNQSRTASCWSDIAGGNHVDIAGNSDCSFRYVGTKIELKLLT